MITSITLYLRSALGRRLTWNEVDSNWQQIRTAVNWLLAANNVVIELDGVAAGELPVQHDFDSMPKQVTVWRKVETTRWIQMATPDVSYLEPDILNKLYINFPEAPGSIKIIIKF